MSNHPTKWFSWRPDRGTPDRTHASDLAWVLAHTSSVTLDDGTAVVVRPILPDDKHHVASLFKQMSSQSRYLRYHHAKLRLTRRDLRYLTEVDYFDHFALIAFTVGESGPSAVGVARYIRFAPASDHAELVLEVIDGHQGRGLGTSLVRLLTQTALEQGVRFFVAYVAPANARVIRWGEEQGGIFTRENGVMRLELSLLGTGSKGSPGP